MMQIVDQIKQNTRLRWNKVYSFKNKINIKIEFGSYIIKTVETHQELISSLKLRHEVFRQEFCGEENSGHDVDKYDHSFDHLIIINKTDGRMIGTYRLSLITQISSSYTAQEFDLKNILKDGGSYLELGRACIHKDFRKGAVVLLLWRGIAEYMNKSGASAVFGCSSIKINNTRDAALVYKYLVENGHTTTEINSHPRSSYIMKDFDIWYLYYGNALNYYQSEEAKELIPSLLKSYLKLGAKIVCEPAYDEDFQCIDLLTVLKKSDLSGLLTKRFSVQ